MYYSLPDEIVLIIPKPRLAGSLPYIPFRPIIHYISVIIHLPASLVCCITSLLAGPVPASLYALTVTV